jgi:hypothetical protein
MSCAVRNELEKHWSKYHHSVKGCGLVLIEKITGLSKGHSPNKFLENLNSKLENKLDCKSSKPKDLRLKRPKPNSKWTVRSLS